METDALSKQEVIFIKTEDRELQPLPVNGILCIYSIENYCCICTKKERIIQHTTLADLEVRCAANENLVRISRSMILNFSCIKLLTPEKKGGTVTLKKEFAGILQSMDDYFKGMSTLPAGEEGWKRLKEFESALDKKETTTATQEQRRIVCIGFLRAFTER